MNKLLTITKKQLFSDAGKSGGSRAAEGDHRRHDAPATACRPVGEKARGIAAGAFGRNVDVLGAKPRLQQKIAVQPLQIGKNAALPRRERGRRTVGTPLREEAVGDGGAQKAAEIPDEVLDRKSVV